MILLVEMQYHYFEPVYKVIIFWLLPDISGRETLFIKPKLLSY